MILLRTLCLCALVSSIVALRPNNARILGGSFTTIDQAPWHALILYNNYPEEDANNYWYETSGALIKDNLVVAPARFVSNDVYRKVRAGSNGARVLGEIRDIKQIVFHEEFDGTNNNVAIVVLVEAYKLTDLINPIPLVGQGVQYPDGTYASFTGYGVMSLPANPIWWLHKIEIPLVNHDICNTFYSTYNVTIIEEQFCAGFIDNIGYAPCYLDEGGPLVIDGQLVGLYETDHYCGLVGDPSVYLNIATFSDWLKEKIEIL